MDFEFDKEIDVLLRQTAQGGGFVSNQTATHLDADEISAFAENALPEKIRQKYTLHLADCDRCRKFLSSLITLNSETESVTVEAEEKHFVAAPLPWYRKLFAFPNLAYTMGALVLVFSGIAVYTVLQSGSNFENAEVSQISEKQPGGKGMGSDGDAATAAMNSSSNSAANFSAMPSAPVAAANSNAAMPLGDADKNTADLPKPVAPAKEPTDFAGTRDSTAAGPPPPAPPASARENEYQVDGELQKQQPNQTQNSIAQNQTDIAPDSRNVKRAPETALRSVNKSRKLEESKDDAAEKSKAVATTSVGGKTFKRENNVWYDSAYRGQATVNVTRGTNEYKKLDSGLRGIAESLGGAVVVVWKAKAYRIQ